MDEANLRERAEKRVSTRAALLSHATTYLVVNAFLFAIDWYQNGAIEWAWWPAAGWGVGLLTHTLSTLAKLGGDNERAIEREMERLRGRKR